MEIRSNFRILEESKNTSLNLKKKRIIFEKSRLIFKKKNTVKLIELLRT